MENIAIYIRGARFCNAIFDGIKTVETRNKPTLDNFVGSRVAVIQSGKSGGSAVVGYVTISGRKWYPASEFHNADNQREHIVPIGSRYDSQNGKYGYILSDPVRVKPIPHKGNGNRVYQLLDHTEMEAMNGNTIHI